ncbi:MAG: ribonuclease Z [Nitrososphaerota archaeon]|nr:ribonuclease Z [Nitrososphaerota archaeon]
MRVVFLGTASSVPTVQRGLSSIAVIRGGEIILFDVGEGAQRAMIISNLNPNKVNKVFITHLHGDHCIGLLGLIQTLSMMGREKPLYVYGPKGIVGFLNDNIRHLKFGLTYPLHIQSVRQGIVVKEKEYMIRATLAEHSIRAYAYRLDEFERPGIFYPEKALALGVPKGILWSKLQHGECVKIGDRVIKPDQVTGPKRRGRSIGISGDTRPHSRLIKFFRGVDLLIFDSTYGDEYADKAVENLHSTAREAGLIAKEAGVKLLVLTHFSARYDKIDSLVAEASTIHPNVTAAYDLLSIDIPYPD